MKSKEGVNILEDQIEHDPLWTAHDIATLLQVSVRQVSERYAMMPGFPAAIRLPSPKGKGINRWKSSDIHAWIESLKKAA